MATLERALDQMYRDGMPSMPSGHPRLNTDDLKRYGPKKRAWYRLYERIDLKGRRQVYGVYGYWGLLPRGGIRIEADWEEFDPVERERWKREQAEAEQRDREKRQKREKFAAHRAAEQWRKATADGFSEYLKRKQVAPEKGIGLRFDPDGTLLVPALRYDQLQGNGKPRLVSLQKIAADGSKRFNKGAAMHCGAFRIGPSPKDGDPIIVTEGLATGLSIRKAISRSHTVFVSFDCGNLEPFAKILRAMYPASPVLFCADDDYLTPCARHKNEGAVKPLSFVPESSRPAWCRCNPGRIHAQRAAAAIGKAYVIAPHFVDRSGNKWTDFNDLHVAEGLEPVRVQLEAGFTLAGAVLAAPAKAAAKKKEPPPPEFWDHQRDLLKRFTLIYPTETAYDSKICEIVKISGMRAAFGSMLVEYWLLDPNRRTVNASDVVFDPSCKCDPKTTVNLFRGMTFAPKAGVCDRLRELLQYLCGEAERDAEIPLTDWVLKWIAYPLQHPGAKMRTAVVMHGHEGTGKNLFWSAISSIYGPYGGLINQFQLQSQFNDWASRKMFIVANEVVTRMELKHLVGYLKNLVTEPRIPIETKNMPVREEDNRMQLVFLSNELRPLHISPLDRRYCVIKTPGAKAKEYYAAVEAELQAGGAAALYQCLLDLDLGDFNEHTKPPETEAKANLVELGLTSTQYFWQEMHDGLLPLPYTPAIVSDVYRAYTIFCFRIGEKNPARLPQFSHEFMSMNGVSRRRGVRLPDPERPEDWAKSSSEWKQWSVFLMGRKPPDESEESWLKKNVGDWRERLREFARFGRGVSSADDDDDAAHEARRSVKQQPRAARPGGAGDPAL